MITKEIVDKMSFFVSRPMTLQRDMIVIHCFKHFKDFHYLSVPETRLTRDVYVDKRTMDESYALALSTVDSFEKWNVHLRHYEDVKKSLLFTTNALKDSVEFDESLFREWQKAMSDYWIIIVLPLAIQDYLEYECKELLEKEGLSDMYEVIAFPDEMNSFQEMRLAIIDAWKGNTSLKYLVDTFAWYGEYSYQEPLLDEAYFKSEIGKITESSAKEEYDRLMEIPRQKEVFELALKKIKSERLRLVACVIHKYTYLRTERVETLKRAQANLRSFFIRLASECKKIDGQDWTFRHIANCTDEEVLQVITKKSLPNKEEIDRRCSQEHIYYYDGEDHIVFGETKNVKDWLSMTEATNSLSGNSAYKGFVRARVKIVLSKDDFEKIEEGDVLVAKTTMPDFLPIMKKASAFVTEEGGIISHAAITSRELKTPCIVGCKGATKVFKDGDLVEVDAVKGIIRKVKE